jgi:multiple sugar transport system substrate-binding protein
MQKILKNRPRTLRRAGVIATVSVAAIAVAGGLAACSSGSTASVAGGNSPAAGASASGGGTYTVWDPYPQYDNSSAWVKLLNTCGASAGVTIARTASDTTALTSKVLLAAQQGNPPDVLIVDNPVVSTLAQAGVLATTAVAMINTAAIQPNLLAAGELGGKTYGIPIGANTLALYYNKTIVAKDGINVDSIKSWTSLTAALAKAKAKGDKGITFSAIGTEEGSFQFLPWFWGAGAQLTTLDSPQAVAALTLWTDWLKNGYAPNSVINDTQTTSWQEFATGKYAFGENGTWQLSNAASAGFPYGIIPIPGQASGSAPAPLGGEFVTVPVQKDTARYATTEKVVTCLSSAANSYNTDSALTYIAATTAVQQEQLAKNPALKVWVSAVAVAKGRTADNLGTKYPKISEQMWTAVQASLSGSKSPQAALAAAQAAVASGTP